MNGSGKQSFYEIQLSNRSLIVAFLVAVGLGVAVFMLGVMVGRGQGPQPLLEGGLVEALGDDTGLTAAVDRADTDFLGRMEEPAEGTSANLGTEAAEPIATSRPAAASPSVASNDLPEADASIASGYVVQVKATSDREEADTLQASLASAGFPAFVVSGDVAGTLMFRVRVGRYREESAAERVAVALSGHRDIVDTWITEG